MSAPSASAPPGDGGSAVSQRPPIAARRRLLLLGCFLLLVVVGFAANYGPLGNYRDARARLEKTTAEVAALEKEEAALQSRLSELGRADYLEGLARQELTYARPGEDLYIVTGTPGEDAPATVPGARPAAGTGVGASVPSGGMAGTGGADGHGFLERVLSAISRLF